MRMIIGAFLIISGTTFCGLTAVRLLSRRTQLLAQLTSAIGNLQSEIEFCLSPLPVIMGKLAVRYPLLAALFGSCSGDITNETCFKSYWDSALEKAALPLKPDEKQILLELGAVLGRYDADGQQNALNMARDRMSEMHRRAAAEQSSKSRLFGFMGVAAGLVLTLLIM